MASSLSKASPLGGSDASRNPEVASDDSQDVRKSKASYGANKASVVGTDASKTSVSNAPKACQDDERKIRPVGGAISSTPSLRKAKASPVVIVTMSEVEQITDMDAVEASEEAEASEPAADEASNTPSVCEAKASPDLVVGDSDALKNPEEATKKSDSTKDNEKTTGDPPSEGACYDTMRERMELLQREMEERNAVAAGNGLDSEYFRSLLDRVRSMHVEILSRGDRVQRLRSNNRRLLDIFNDFINNMEGWLKEAR
jgi:hypothetical protein